MLRFIRLPYRLVTAFALAMPAAAVAQVQLNQNFVAQGPAPSFGPTFTVQSGDAPPNGHVTGAIETVITDPTNANRYFIGTPNAGIWETTNGGATWTALTDKQASLSIASLAFDPTDPNRNTLIAGTGLTSNGSVCPGTCFAGSGGLRNGILYSKDGGATWTSLGATTLGGHTVDAVAAIGNVLLAGTFEPSFAASAAQQRVGGLYRSPDGGTTFNLVSGTGGLPLGPISSIVTDPNNSNRIFAAVSSPAAGQNANTAVYVSNDAGVSWTQVFSAAQSNSTISGASQTVLKIASAPGGALAVGVVDLSTSKVTGLFYSANSGSTWTTLGLPVLNPGSQAPVNFAIAIDPNNTKFVYVSGDRIAADPFTVQAYRIDAVDTPGTPIRITDTKTADGSTVHADSRSIAFDANGRLILTSDGGIYARTDPSSNSGAWSSLIGNATLSAPYAVAYDAVGNRLIAAGQDTGVTIQSARNSPLWNATHGGDGINAIVNDVTLKSSGLTVFYGNTESLGFMARVILDKNGNEISPNTAGFGFGATVTCNGGQDCSTQVTGRYFSSPWVSNRVDPTRMALAGTRVYVTQDTTLTGANDRTATSVDLTLTDLGGTGGNSVGPISYGTNDNPNMLVAGTLAGLVQSTTSAASSLVAVLAYGGAAPIGIVLDPRSQNRYFVADFTNLFGTTNQGTTFTTLTSNLPAGIIRPTALEFISSNGVNALLVGGLNNVANAQSTIAAADSDTTGNLSNWRPFGTGLPNTQVSALSYNSAADMLAVGTFGHGVFALYDVTSYFPQAIVLQFGLANNDSMPDVSFLTDGTVGNRPLIKYGSGTLTVAGNASYTGGTTINGGALVLGTGSVSGSILGNVTFCTGAADPSCDPSTNKSLVFNRSDTYTFGGAITGAGQVLQFGNGTTILTGNSTYTGPTTVDGGTLSVNGSITSAVTVNNGGTLGGNGIVGASTINAGGTLSPGNSIGLITINGTLVFGAGAIYKIEVSGASADKTVVTAAATLTGGTVQVVPLALPTQKQFTVLTAAGGLGGTTFGGSTAPVNFNATLSYTATDVVLNLTAALGAGSALSPNASSVAGAINTIVNSGGTPPTGVSSIFALTGNDLSSALSSLSGEVHASAVSVLADESLYVRSAVLGRLRQAGYGEIGTMGPMAALRLGGPQAFADGNEITALAYAKSPIVTKAPLMAPVATSDVVFWAQGFGAWGRFNSDGNAATVSRDLAGFISGVDTRVGANGRAGLAAGYTGSQNALDGRGSANVETGHVAAYGGWTSGPLNLRGSMAYAFHTISTDRSIVFPGFFDRAFANYNGGTGQIFGEAGYGFALANLAIEPFAGAAWVRVHSDGGVERAMTAGLNFAATNFEVGYATLGIRAASLASLQNGMVLIPRASVAWQHAFSSVTPNDVLAFQLTPTVPFTIAGVPIARDAALVEAGLDLALNAHATIGASYSAQLARNVTDHAAKGKFSWKF